MLNTQGTIGCSCFCLYLLELLAACDFRLQILSASSHVDNMSCMITVPVPVEDVRRQGSMHSARPEDALQFVWIVLVDGLHKGRR